MPIPSKICIQPSSIENDTPRKVDVLSDKVDSLEKFIIEKFSELSTLIKKIEKRIDTLEPIVMKKETKAATSSSGPTKGKRQPSFPKSAG